ncbi:unnamed protein product [Brassica oleracea]
MYHHQSSSYIEIQHKVPIFTVFEIFTCKVCSESHLSDSPWRKTRRNQAETHRRDGDAPYDGDASEREECWEREESLAVEAGDPEVSTTKEKRGDGGAEGEERDLRVGEGRELGGGGGGSGGECGGGEEKGRRSGGRREISASKRSSGCRETTSWRSLAVEAEASAAVEKRRDRGAEGEERDLRVREELGVAGDDVVTELGVEEADRLVETLGGGV